MPFARRRRQTASPSSPGIVTSSTITSGAERSAAASAAPPSAATLDLEALGREAAREHAPHRRVVVDHEDALGHRVSRRRRRGAGTRGSAAKSAGTRVERAHPGGADDRRPVDRARAAGPARR